MKTYRLADISDTSEGHFLKGILPGDYICQGGMGFKKPGERTHSSATPHVHEDSETFVILQGKGEMDINGVRHPVKTGDIVVVEPGEEHHLISDKNEPCVNLWLHVGAHRNPGSVKSSMKE
jgi:mannose-6-phosphate isomerase-like protein (cupin superfamily)